MKFGYIAPEGVLVRCIRSIQVGSDVTFSPYCSLYCQDPENGSVLILGDRVRLNHNVMLNADGGGKIIIGSDVLIGPNVVIRAANHQFNNPSRKIVDQGHAPGKIVIEDNVWIAANVVILPGVTIGTGAVIAAGAVVLGDVAPFTVAGGVPAKEIKPTRR